MLLIIHEQIKPDDFGYKDCYKSYDVLDACGFGYLCASATVRTLLKGKTIPME